MHSRHERNILKGKMITNKVLSEKTVDPDPFVQFQKWYNEHLETGIDIPDSVSLGTASAAGRVSVRTVLLKGFDEKGFVFYTNFNSKKGMQISENPYVAMLFYWTESGRQVRIEGITEKVTEKVSVSYFSTRPRNSQISAWASEQSSVIPGRPYLENRKEFYEKMFENKQVEKPSQWGGYRLIPDWFEFWSDREFRLHDRIVYTRSKEGWVINRLAP
jgi:pyridoxamine 5'-phosphate oxidase